MAGENEMKVIIGADSTALTKEFGKAEKSVSGFTNRMTDSVKQNQASFNALEKSASSVSDSLNKIPDVLIKADSSDLRKELTSSGSLIDRFAAKSITVEVRATTDIRDSLAALQSIKNKANDIAGSKIPVSVSVAGIENLQAAVKSIQNDFKAIPPATIPVKTDTSSIKREILTAVESVPKTARIIVTSDNTLLRASLASGTGEINSFTKNATALAHVPVTTDISDLSSDLTAAAALFDNFSQKSIDSVRKTAASMKGIEVAPIRIGSDKTLQDLENQLKRFKDTLANTNAQNVTGILRVNSAIEETSRRISVIHNLGKQPIFSAQVLEGPLRSFNITLNNGIKDGIQGFHDLKREAIGMSGVLEKIPASLSGFNTTGLVTLRSAVKGIKDEINTVKVGGLISQLNQISPAAQRAGAGLSSLPRRSGEATQSLINLGRVVQDAPFGFMGIANNINPLVESFQRLTKETGSSKKAFSVLLASLSGAGGVGLAISGITFAMAGGVTMIQKFISKFTEVGAATAKAKAKAEEYANTLTSVVSALASESARVSELVRAIQTETTTRNEKKSALEELQKIAPKYFSQLKEEKGLVDDLVVAYNSYQSGLLQQAKAKIFQKQLEGLLETKIKLQLSIDPRSPANMQAFVLGKTSDIREQFRKTFTIKPTIDAAPIVKAALTVADAISTPSFKAGAKAGQEMQSGFRSVNIFDMAQTPKQIASLDTQINFVMDQLKGLSNVTIDPFKTKGKKADAILEGLKTTLAGYNKELQVTNELREKGVLPIFRENDALKLQEDILNTLLAIDKREVAIKVKSQLEIDPQLHELKIQQAIQEFAINSAAKVQIPLNFTFSTQKFGEQSTEVQDALKKAGFSPVISPALSLTGLEKSLGAMTERLAQAGQAAGEALRENLKLEQVSAIVNNVLTPAFSAFFDTLLEGSGNPFKALVQSFKKLIAQLLATLAVAAVLAAVMASIFPGVSAGGASFMKNFKSVLGGGGGLSGILAGLFGEQKGVAAPSTGAMNRGLTGMAAQQFIITGELKGRGNDLLGIINTTNNRNIRKF